MIGEELAGSGTISTAGSEESFDALVTHIKFVASKCVVSDILKCIVLSWMNIV